MTNLYSSAAEDFVNILYAEISISLSVFLIISSTLRKFPCFCKNLRVTDRILRKASESEK